MEKTQTKRYTQYTGDPSRVKVKIPALDGPENMHALFRSLEKLHVCLEITQ